MKSRKAGKPVAASQSKTPLRAAAPTVDPVDRRRARWAGGLLIALTLLAYVPVLADGYIWDDDAYVTRNLTLRSLPGLWAMWVNPFTLPQYYPLVHTTYWVEFHLWGLIPIGFHATNVLLHAMAAVLFWRVLLRLKVPGAWWGAALFALHPVSVESVAWITERKNTLSLPLTLGAMLCYYRFAPVLAGATDDQHGRRSGNYILAFALFVAALLSKTVVATFPAVLLVIAWWKNGRITRRDVVPLIPFFAVGIGLGMFTAWIERIHVGARGDEWDFSRIDRVLIAGRAVWFYAGKLCWPHPLVFFYPRWTIDDTVWWQHLFPLSAVGTVLALWLARPWVGRGPLAAALIFGGVLVPALGFFDVYPFRYSFVADHFQYHASLAFFALAGAGFAWCVQAVANARAGTSSPARWPVGWFVGAPLLFVLGLLAARQTLIFANTESLYRDIIRKNPRSWTAYGNLGAELAIAGRKDEALELFQEALAVDPNRPIIHANYGQALFDLGKRDGFAPGQLDDSMAHFRRALELDADWFQARVGLAEALLEDKQNDEAKRQLLRALTIKANDAKALAGMGYLSLEEQNWVEAKAYFERAVRANPTLDRPYHGIGLALINMGKFQEAIAPLQTSLQLNPGSYEAHYHLANALYNLGDHRTALDQYHEALRIKPDYLDALSNLGVALGQLGDLDGAIECFEHILRVDPEFNGAQSNLEHARDLRKKQGSRPVK